MIQVNRDWRDDVHAQLDAVCAAQEERYALTEAGAALLDARQPYSPPPKAVTGRDPSGRWG